MSLEILCKVIAANNVQEEYVVYEGEYLSTAIERAYRDMDINEASSCTLEIYAQDAECHKLVSQSKLRSQVSLSVMPELGTQIRVPGYPQGRYYTVVGSCILHNGAKSEDNFRKGILLKDSVTDELHSVSFQEWFDLIAQDREAVVREREQAGTKA